MLKFLSTGLAAGALGLAATAGASPANHYVCTNSTWNFEYSTADIFGRKRNQVTAWRKDATFRGVYSQPGVFVTDAPDGRVVSVVREEWPDGRQRLVRLKLNLVDLNHPGSTVKFNAKLIEDDYPARDAQDQRGGPKTTESPISCTASILAFYG